jgi:type I restriction enzyme S subunit
MNSLAAKNAEAWPMVRLGDVCEVVLGGTPSTKIDEYWNGDVNWLTPSDMSKIRGLFVSETSRKITRKGLEKGSRLFPPKSVIVSTRAPIGYVLVNTIAMCTNQGCKTLVPKDNLLAEYLCHNLRGRSDELNALGTGTTFRELATGVLKDIQIPLPPLFVQKEIVERLEKELGEADKVAANFRKIAEMADAEFKAELYETFGKLERREFLTQRRKGAESACPMVRLGDVFDVVSARRVHKSDWKTKGIPFYRAREIVKLADFGCVENQLFISENLYERYKNINGVPQANDLMVSAVGTIGRIYIVKEGDRFYYKDASVLCFKNKLHVNPWFAKYYFESPKFLAVIHEESKGATVDTITMERAKEYPFLLPSIEVQKEIVAKLDAAKKRCEKLKAEAERGLKAAENLRKAILSEAFE